MGPGIVYVGIGFLLGVASWWTSANGKAALALLAVQGVALAMVFGGG